MNETTKKVVKEHIGNIDGSLDRMIKHCDEAIVICANISRILDEMDKSLNKQINKNQ